MLRHRPLKDIGFVSIQLLLFIAYIWPLSLFIFTMAVWIKYLFLLLSLVGILIIIIAIIQLNQNLTPFPSPKVNGSLINQGLYKYMRHPIYSGIIITTFSWGVYSNSIWRIVIAMLLFILFYFKSVYEEKLLDKKFNQYSEYAKSTKRFFPFI